MARGYCLCLARQRTDGSCNTTGRSKYRISRAGSRAVRGTIAVRMQLSPFASRVAYTHRLHKKTTAGTLSVLDSSQPQPSRSASSTAELPEIVIPAPSTPSNHIVSDRVKLQLVQALWEQLSAVRALLGPDMACNIIGSAIEAVQLVDAALPMLPPWQLTGAFLVCGAAMAGSDDTLDAVRKLHPGCCNAESAIMHCMRPFIPEIQDNLVGSDH